MPHRLFRPLLIALALLAAAPAGGDTHCPADRTDERIRVDFVYDGDTIRLDDGRSVRLIGLDTPEIGHDGAPTQPFAEQARTALEKLLIDHPYVRLRYDAERQDRYRRTLAHVYLDDGRSVAALLIEQGLATTLVVPPDLWNIDCYRAAEQRAQTGRRGIWTLPAYQPVTSTALATGAQGFHLVRGRVTRVGGSRKSVRLTLEGGVSLRIERDDLHYFSTPPEQLHGRTVIVRGWPHPGAEGAPVIRIRHPAALEVVH
ncbi:MAG: thermonuclease family protein [Gammaproteobacteria bacterium]|nr:thermonuclease family protein [Gammaproteobacteria bacterium]